MDCYGEPRFAELREQKFQEEDQPLMHDIKDSEEIYDNIIKKPKKIFYYYYTLYLLITRDREQLIVLQYYCNTIAIVLYGGEGR